MRSSSETGSVTAELAIALPSVVLVIFVTLAGFGLQIERMKLVSMAAGSARALARGEGELEVRTLSREVDSKAALFIEHLENHICARLSKTFSFAGIQEIEVSERQCARKSGL
jgi:hypothetical protein